ncbi:MAG: response regulator [Granulosicoccus sp.]
MKKRLLLVEDEEVILKALSRLLTRNHYEIVTALTVEAAIEAQPQSFDLILADLRLPGAEGTDIIPLADPVPVIIMTSHASVRSAVEAMQKGAIDYIAKPFDHDELLLIIRRSLMQNQLQAQNHALKLDLRRVLPFEQHVAGTSLEPLLAEMHSKLNDHRFLYLYGEPGTDREGLARSVHCCGERSDAPFVVADIPTFETDRASLAIHGNTGNVMLDDYLPGGLLQAANNGTLVLRHLELLPLEIQQQLARVLRQGSVSGPSGQRTINAHVVAVAQEPLEQLVINGVLHSEIAALFEAARFEVPPLRQRRNDVLSLARRAALQYSYRHHRPEMTFSAESEQVLTAADWPGNVAELDSAVERAVLLARGSTITPADLAVGIESVAGRDLNLDEYFRYFVLRHQAKLSETEIAHRLGISRKALWERRQRMQLPRA